MRNLYCIGLESCSCDPCVSVGRCRDRDDQWAGGRISADSASARYLCDVNNPGGTCPHYIAEAGRESRPGCDEMVSDWSARGADSDVCNPVSCVDRGIHFEK